MHSFGFGSAIVGAAGGRIKAEVTRTFIQLTFSRALGIRQDVL
jgi:hypothetical protein